MEKIIDGHICGFETVKDMERLENYYDEDVTDVGLTIRRWPTRNYNKQEFDRMCEEKSGEVTIIKPSR
ncbi:hypothetical protein [Oceanobacillus oncorhynchi]|uniref:hypothetical protein n=1 Tax=Oceanobacillus oncorhynchi TaxID=545501 RepID=UPI001865F705|nr:hypothetical protein [Oceanobacillus oncorhynchi]